MQRKTTVCPTFLDASNAFGPTDHWISFKKWESWKKYVRGDPYEIRRQCLIIWEFFQHIKQFETIRCLLKIARPSTALTIISANIEGLLKLCYSNE